MKRFKGAITALVTPFVNGSLDEDGLGNLIQFQLDKGIHGILPCGTTGETATLDFHEFRRVIDISVEAAAGKIPVIAGAGANDTAKAVQYTDAARKTGADAALSVVPYYNKPNQEGIYHHFKTVAESVDLPIILYNVPSRAVINMLPETVARLAEIPNIIGIKEACGSLEQITEIIRLCPEEFLILSGDDFTCMPTVLIGGSGVFSVVSNVDPSGVTAMMEAALSRDLDTAKREHYRLFQLMKLMFKSPSPGPAKAALRLKGIIKESASRLPITDADATVVDELNKELINLKLI